MRTFFIGTRVNDGVKLELYGYDSSESLEEYFNEDSGSIKDSLESGNAEFIDVCITGSINGLEYYKEYIRGLLIDVGDKASIFDNRRVRKTIQDAVNCTLRDFHRDYP